MLYTIKVLPETDAYPVARYRRCDAAAYYLERLVYRIIEGNAGLDTQQGHATIQKARDLDVTRGGTFSAYHYTIIVTPSRS